MRLIRWIMLGTLSVLVLVFALSNRQKVGVSFFPFETSLELPLYVIFFITLMVGVFLGGIFTLIEKLKEILMLRKKDQTINALKNEVEALRAEKKIAASYQTGDNSAPASKALLQVK